MAKTISPLHQSFGTTVRSLRRSKKLSQEELAKRTDLHRNYIGGVERGELNPSLTNIVRLASDLGVKSSLPLQRIGL